jgi:hypothetical protein
MPLATLLLLTQRVVPRLVQGLVQRLVPTLVQTLVFALKFQLVSAGVYFLAPARIP